MTFVWKIVKRKGYGRKGDGFLGHSVFVEGGGGVDYYLYRIAKPLLRESGLWAFTDLDAGLVTLRYLSERYGHEDFFGTLRLIECKHGDVIATPLCRRGHATWYCLPPKWTAAFEWLLPIRTCLNVYLPMDNAQDE